MIGKTIRELTPSTLKCNKNLHNSSNGPRKTVLKVEKSLRILFERCWRNRSSF